MADLNSTLVRGKLRVTEDEAVSRFARKLRGMGVEEALEQAGAKRGDEVQILDYIFEFKE